MEERIQKKQLKQFIVALFGLIAVVSLAVLYLASPKSKTSSGLFTEEEIEHGSNDKNYQIKEEGVTYTFQADGTLKVSGSGATKSFTTPEEAKEWYLTELYHAYSGWYPERDEQLYPFVILLDRVTDIEVAEGITALGDCFFTPFSYVETVSAPVTLKYVGNYTFLGAGQSTEKELVLSGFDNEALEYGTMSLAATPEEVFTVMGRAFSADIPARSKEEQGTEPSMELLLAAVTMGEEIQYRLYENGVLYVKGFGNTYDFDTFLEMEQYLMEELHLTSRQEVREQWSDRVVEIVIEEGVKRIGDNALAQYKQVRSVHGESIEAGHRAFFQCGNNVKEETVWNITLLEEN